MSFESVMADNNGYWDNQFAMIHMNQTVRCIAIGNKDAYKLTDFGETLVNTSAHVVESEQCVKATRKRKEKPAAEPNIDELEI